VKEAREEQFNMQGIDLPIDTDATRLDGRRSLREELDSHLNLLEREKTTDTLHRQYRMAFDMLLSTNVRKAFDLQQEPLRVREQYGTTKIGQRCLLSRRLVEAGARFVMVDYGYDPEFGNLWDNHNAPTQKHPPLCEMVKLPYHLAGVDRAFAALIEDLHARGLLESTLVVFLTEFGRTPKFNANGGRDHWGKTGSLFFAGGGTKGGQVIGATDRQGASPTTDRYTPADIAACIYAQLGIDPEQMIYDRQNRPVPLCPDGRIIPGIA
jgi:hypothetical protein